MRSDRLLDRVGAAPTRSGDGSLVKAVLLLIVACLAALLVAGLKNRTPAGIALAVIGGGLAYRAYSGHCDLYEAAGIRTAGTPLPAPPAKAAGLVV